MARARYRGPNYNPYQRPHFNPFVFDDPPRSSTRSYDAPTPTHDAGAPRSTERNHYAPALPRASAEEMEALSIHEASHVVIALLRGREIDSVHVDSSDGTGLCCTNGFKLDRNSPFYENRARGMLRFLLAGECGVIHEGFPASQARAGSSSDRTEAAKIAAEFLSLDPDDLSEDDEEAIEELLDQEREKTSRALERNWNLVKEIAGELETRGRLDGGRIARIVEDFPLEYPPKRAAAPPVKRFAESLEIRRLPHALSMRREPPPAVARSYDSKTRTVDAVISTGRAVRRSDWSGEFDEVLEISNEAIRLERLNSGAQLLDAYRWYGGLDSIVGAIIPGSARIEGGELRARFKLSNGDLGRRVAKDLADGLPLQLSAGYRIHAYKEDVKSKPPVRRVVDWEPYEISIVSVPAESSGTGFRSRMAA